ncbi:MAG: DMT family transporter [Candidatus Eisenbacteria bacterium]
MNGLHRDALARGVTWILLSETLFALMRLATRWGAADVPGIEIGAARFLGGALVAWGVARARGVSLAIGDQRTAWLRSGFGTLNAVAVFYVLGQTRIALGDVATLQATGPLFVALLSYPLIGERVSRRVAGGVALGFVGLTVLVGPAFRTSGDLAAIMLAGAFCYAVAMLSLRRLGSHETSEGIAFHLSLVAGVVLLLLALPRFAAPGTRAWEAIVASALCGGLAQVAMSRAYALDRAARMSAFAYAGVAITYGLEAVTWHRFPVPHQWTGAALVVVAGVLVSGRRRVPAAART